MAIIEVNHLSKEYQLGHLTSLKETAVNTLRKIAFQPVKQKARFKALDDITFHIDEGEVVGIIGHNGAGKSTLLKHLAHISKPTKGKVIIRGSVAPLIEVGAGVNPELTGRENIFLNAAILGIPKKVVKQKLDEIIDFSELEEFIDTPVKRYSSGMTVKLGFSIATSMDADILIIDEVLAVGDLAFQRKCFDRMESLIKRQGKTVLLVSHNLRQVARICSRTIMLNHGKIDLDGNSEEVCNAFYEYNNQKILEKNKKSKQIQQTIDDTFELNRVEIINSKNEVTQSIVSGEALTVKAIFTLNREIEKPEIVIGTHTTDFIYLTANSTNTLADTFDLKKGTHEIYCQWPVFPLKIGVYCVRFVIFDQFRGVIFSGENLLQFEVKNYSESKEPPLRLLDIPCQWKIPKGDISSHLILENINSHIPSSREEV